MFYPKKHKIVEFRWCFASWNFESLHSLVSGLEIKHAPLNLCKMNKFVSRLSYYK